MQTTPSRRYQFFQANRASIVMRTIIAATLIGILALASQLTVSPAFAQGGAVVKVDPASSSVNVGEIIVVNIRIDNVTNLAGAEVHLVFDPLILEVQPLQAGGFPAPDFVAQSSATGGSVDFAIAQLPAQHQPVSGGGILLKMAFKGLAAGTATLHITSAVLSDSGATLIASTTQDGSITVGGSGGGGTPAPTTAPVPTTVPVATPVPGSTTVKVVSSASAVNSSVMIPLQIANASNLWGVDLKIIYDPTILQCTQTQIGAVPVPDVIAKNTCANGVAEYIVTQQSPRAPATGSGDVVRLTFTCLKVGTSALHIDHATLVNKDGQALDKTAVDGTITCGAPANILGKHIVKLTETLFCIGRAYGVSPWAIASTNGVRWPYTIYPSQTLQIPDVRWYNIPAGPVCVKQFDVTPVPTPQPTTVPTPGPVCAQPYVVQPGDTLFWISFRFGVDVNTLATRNHIANINLIYAYTTICIK
jgi:LysM repeat protein